MAEVFISYHEASAGLLAEAIAGRLDAAGITSWCARRNMPPGADFARTIPKQINTCKVFLLLLNENVYHSDHIESEVGLAFSRRNKKRNLQILPVEIGDFTREDWIEYYLIHTQSVKFPAEPDEQRLQGLVGQVARLLGKEAVQTPLPAKIIKRGKCGDNVDFTLDENGVLTISGTGPMRDFEYAGDAPWWDKRNTIFYVAIQDSVTIIGDCAFMGCSALTSVTIPDSVISIGDWAFDGCARLTSVTIPHSVSTIRNWTFSNCTSLTSVTIPSSVTTIKDCAFYGCTELTSVSVSLKAEIADNAFPDTVHIECRA